MEAVRRGAVQHPDELAQLLTHVAPLRPRCIVEIGTDRGGSFWAWCRVAAPDATLISIDLHAGPWSSPADHATPELLDSYAGAGQRIIALDGDSHDPTTQLRLEQALLEHTYRTGHRGVSFLFIDGDHSYQGVKHDFWAYSPLVNPGGLIALHDIAAHPPHTGVHVDQLWAELRHATGAKEIVSPGAAWGGIGLIQLPT